jgi:hypothetical protein
MNVIIGIKKLDYDQDENVGYAEAFIEDYTTANDSSEIEGFPVDLYWANFSLKSDEVIPEDPEELCIFFEELDLNWKYVTP